MTIPLATRRRRRQEDFGVAARIRLNRRVFNNYCTVAGLKTLQQKGDFFGIDSTHIGRILNDQRAVGADFIAAVVDAFVAKGMDTGEVFTEVFDVCHIDTDNGGDTDNSDLAA